MTQETSKWLVMGPRLNSMACDAFQGEASPKERASVQEDGAPQQPHSWRPEPQACPAMSSSMGWQKLMNHGGLKSMGKSMGKSMYEHLYYSHGVWMAGKIIRVDFSSHGDLLSSEPRRYHRATSGDGLGCLQTLCGWSQHRQRPRLVQWRAYGARWCGRTGTFSSGVRCWKHLETILTTFNNHEKEGPDLLRPESGWNGAGGLISGHGSSRPEALQFTAN